MLEELRSKEREAHLQEKKDFSNRIQNLYKKARADLQEDIVEKKQMDSGIVNTWEYKINSLVRAIKESYAKMQVGEFQFYNIISTYNDACIYLKNIVKYSSLNQSYKLQFDQDFKKVLPALQDIEYYAIKVKNISEPAIQEMIKNIENKTYNTIGAELGVKTLKSGTLEKQLLINKIDSLKEFINSNKNKVMDRAKQAELSGVKRSLADLKTKLIPNSVDWNRVEQQQKKEDALTKFNKQFTIADTIIQFYLDAEEKAREEAKRKKEEEEADRKRAEEAQKLLQEEQRILARVSPKTLKEYFKARPDRQQVIDDFFSSPPPRIIKGATKFPSGGPTKLLGLIDASLKNAKDELVPSNLEREMNLAQNPSVNMQLNQANKDQQQQLAPVLVKGDTEKKEPSINLQVNTPPPQVEVKTPEPVQNQANDKQQLLNPPEESSASEVKLRSPRRYRT